MKYIPYYMYKYKQLVLILIIIYCYSCKEAFYPKLDEAQKMLVVDGLLTDASNIISVRLSNAVPFRNQAYLPEEEAILIVSDDLGREFDFIEKDPGIYESKAFHYEYGRAYTLSIKTKTNKYYKSSPQTLFPKSGLDSVSAVVTSKTLQTNKNGELILKTLSGLEFKTILNNSLEVAPYYRFSNSVLIEYTQRLIFVIKPDSFPHMFNSWKKYEPNQFFNLNEHEYNNSIENIHTLAFCPIDTTYFSIVKEEFYSPIYPYKLDHTFFKKFYYFGITIKKYHINEDVYKIYKSINEQLQANNRIFDPVSFQVRGNITNIDNPEEPVLGVFEVSSTNMRTFSFSDFEQDKTGRFKEINPMDIENLPATGMLYNQYPSFWIYNY